MINEIKKQRESNQFLSFSNAFYCLLTMMTMMLFFRLVNLSMEDDTDLNRDEFLLISVMNELWNHNSILKRKQNWIRTRILIFFSTIRILLRNRIRYIMLKHYYNRTNQLSNRFICKHTNCSRVSLVKVTYCSIPNQSKSKNKQSNDFYFVLTCQTLTIHIFFSVFIHSIETNQSSKTIE